MTQKEIDKFLANTKVYVNGKSKDIQEKLFSLGYKWYNGDIGVCHTEFPFLFIYKNKFLSWNDNMVYFSAHGHREISAEEILSLEITDYDNKVEGLVEEEVGLVDKFSSRCVNEFNLPEDYVFKDENGNVINATKIVLERKKKEYPKTYEECAKVLLDRASVRNDSGYKGELLVALQKLLVCRDAYWKIAGEEMGLGKPWEPDWENSEEKRYCIVNIEGDINLPEKILTKWILKVTNKILAFPTEEMRDAFYENFKSEIESCKELL